jgi:hypothetical protein
VALFQIALVEIALLGAYVLQEPAFKSSVLILYLGANVGPVAGLLYLIRGRRKVGVAMSAISGDSVLSPRHIFDRPTVQLSSRMLICVLLLLAWVGGSYWNESFLLQSQNRVLRPIAVRVHRFTTSNDAKGYSKDEEGVEVCYTVVAPESDPFEMLISQLHALPSGWRIVDSRSFVNQDGRRIPAVPKADFFQVGDSSDWRVIWPKLEPKTQYEFSIYLHRGKSEVSAEAVKASIESGKTWIAKTY